MGAWIEIDMMNQFIYKIINVAPHMGAWIEMSEIFSPSHDTSVAPHMGAWIEIY